MRTAYKTIPKGFKSRGHQRELGKWYSVKGELKPCKNGFHASKLLSDAFSYVTPYWVCKVEYRGEVITDDGKFVAREMRVVKRYRWKKKDSVTFAVACARRVLKHFEAEFPGVSRPRKAIEAAEAWIKNPTRKNRGAARIAAQSAWSAAQSAESVGSAAQSAESVGSAAQSAWSAAWSAAQSAWSAAWSAARSAESAARSAESAAQSAARSAESAAWSVGESAESAWSVGESAWSAERNWQHRKILSIIRENGGFQ